MEELVSIIVPVYNVEKYIKRCIDSIMGQTYQTLEIILVDDGSWDSSGKICDKFAKKDKRITVVHKKNGGASSARNAGLEIANGKYICFIDADDWIENDMIKCLYNLIKAKKVDISMCDFTRKPRELEKGITTDEIVLYDNEALQKLFYRLDGGKNYYSAWCRLYKAELLKEIRFVEKKINEDVLFLYEAYKKANSMAFIKVKKYLYYKNEVSMTRNKLCDKDFSLLKMWDEIVQREADTDFSLMAKLNRKRATFTLYTKGLIFGISEDFDREILKKWKKELKINYHELMKGSFLDWKRKILLFMICKIL